MGVLHILVLLPVEFALSAAVDFGLLLYMGRRAVSLEALVIGKSEYPRRGCARATLHREVSGGSLHRVLEAVDCT
jgi:hypothetical protein